MANQIFMRVNEVAEELGVSVPYAYKLIRQMNEELAKTGCISIKCFWDSTYIKSMATFWQQKISNLE